MRRSSAPTEIPLPITYTPTTHRISKAKKGKRVHACEFPGCNKVFTRAEHRRRHELNHNPEALFRCSHSSCKKAFHRPDLLARHMERHELESQMNQPHWTQQLSEPSTSYVPKCAPQNTHPSPFLTAASTQPQNTMSIGSIVGPAIHPDLAGDCGLVWNGIDVPSDTQSSLYPQQPSIHESVEDTHFYTTPEPCPSPLSDGPTLSIPSHSRSSVCSTPAAMVDSYPEVNILEPDLTSSPVPVHASARSWDHPDASNMSHMVQISLHESLIQPPLQCQYPPQGWATPHHLHYDEHALPAATHYPPSTAVAWKSWSP
ncbi:C2H2 finger domain protein [Aspergillus ambiguus]|uniref:C2H2 finger domain protein n=1 Tax=Aspergillus ambiguus TaxID=176160 RepID=UPI003CCDD461